MKTIRLTAVLLVLAILLTGCFSSNQRTEAEKTLGISLKEAKEISRSDDHGGFHGDGTLSICYEFPDDSLEEILKTAPHWKALPVEEALQPALYLHIAGAELYGEEGDQLLPEVENGYYFFYDRHSESTDPYDGSEAADRYSYNFSAAIYDADTNRLYYTEFDT